MKTKQRIKPIPERLVRLNRELMSGEKKSDIVHATSGIHRIPVEIFPIGKGKYRATADFGGHAHIATHSTPGNAFAKVVSQLQWRRAQLTSEENIVRPLREVTR